ncbi:hypothetical protein KP509_22G061000 [Ceratopteris richardii]|uniref:RING-type domain-containing protein n=1 Tax=Ceratopteris richardii TaxID=49495 RepID=A0A8T2S6S7_CERRI|nr:hypothetical protein KP509_22G061000 [Ceratopteris richardii]
MPRAGGRPLSMLTTFLQYNAPLGTMALLLHLFGSSKTDGIFTIWLLLTVAQMILLLLHIIFPIIRREDMPVRDMEAQQERPQESEEGLSEANLLNLQTLPTAEFGDLFISPVKQRNIGGENVAINIEEAKSAISVHETGYACCICFEDLQTKSEVFIFSNCRHCFHVACVSTWIAVHDSCPTCRKPVFS